MNGLYFHTNLNLGCRLAQFKGNVKNSLYPLTIVLKKGEACPSQCNRSLSLQFLLSLPAEDNISDDD